MLSWVYVILFALQVLWLIRAWRVKRGIGRVLVCNILSIGLACFLLWYFDTLPGYGLMPGFAYFPEVFCSLCAAVVFAVLALASFLCWLYHKKK